MLGWVRLSVVLISVGMFCVLFVVVFVRLCIVLFRWLCVSVISVLVVSRLFRLLCWLVWWNFVSMCLFGLVFIMVVFGGVFRVVW